MVQYLRHHQLRKGGESIKDDVSQNENLDPGYCKRTRSRLFSLFFLTLLSCCFVLAPSFIGFSFNLPHLYPLGTENDQAMFGLCSSVSSGTICCDRTGYRSDICMIKGDVRTHSSSSSIFLYNSISLNMTNVSRRAASGKQDNDRVLQHEKIKPYTRKWEASVMDTIDELNIISKRVSLGTDNHSCDVHHDVPALFFSTGGYTGNVYHEFNDGIIPLFITSQHFNKQVVFVILEYHSWWIMKYGDILSHLSAFPAIDFNADNRTHCFPEAIVGLRIHDELTVDSSLMKDNKSIVDFRNLLDRAYWPRIKGLIQDEAKEAQDGLFPVLTENQGNKPKLTILSRTGSRMITNENLLAKIAGEIGFKVEVLKPGRTTELAKIYRALNASQVMIGVHGAAMTHFLFMRPSSVFIQVIPLGTSWAAETYYGEPAKKLGLKYIGYRIHAKESSLYRRYDRDDPVLREPESINKKGWEYTKKIYLDSQNVTLDLKRFQKRLRRAYEYSVSKLKMHLSQ
ncbi:xylan glycosyltransferase MUCI21-like [Prosopis cineraria]|uniref:xylan glycosyltransferase MUCI21-like n=1 Tax=Prosopis cineraria TaxID=364024 RepID=UPI0024105A91|nr:xylan glycosyltransferase MUCI21-like [Prosopis cineraria]